MDLHTTNLKLLKKDIKNLAQVCIFYKIPEILCDEENPDVAIKLIKCLRKVLNKESLTTTDISSLKNDDRIKLIMIELNNELTKTKSEDVTVEEVRLILTNWVGDIKITSSSPNNLQGGKGEKRSPVS